MSRMLIVVGDALQRGGAVLSGSPHTDIDGRAVARVGDKVLCTRHGAGAIVTGDPTLLIDGQAVARNGDKASCGCVLLAGKQPLVHVNHGGDVGSAVFATAPKRASNVIASSPSPVAPSDAPTEEASDPGCWVQDHDVRISGDIDGRYYEAYASTGERHNYSFPVSYRIEVPLKTQADIVVSIEVKVVPMPGITAAEVASVKQRMAEGISRYWNGKLVLGIRDPECGSRKRPIRYEVRWVDGGGDYMLFIHRRYEREQVSYPDIDVSLSTTVWTFAHEFAHCIGLPDEYSYNDPDEETVRYIKPDGSFDPETLVAKPDSRELSDPDATIMNAEDCNAIKPRHAWNIAREVQELLRHEIGREITCTVE